MEHLKPDDAHRFLSKDPTAVCDDDKTGKVLDFERNSL
jgi:hypothetical protein